MDFDWNKFDRDMKKIDMDMKRMDREFKQSQREIEKLDREIKNNPIPDIPYFDQKKFDYEQRQTENLLEEIKRELNKPRKAKKPDYFYPRYTSSNNQDFQDTSKDIFYTRDTSQNQPSYSDYDNPTTANPIWEWVLGGAIIWAVALGIVGIILGDESFASSGIVGGAIGGAVFCGFVGLIYESYIKNKEQS